VLIRQAFMLVISFAGGVALARILDPAEFGVYAIAWFFVEISGLLLMFGFTQSLIQSKTEPTTKDLQVVWTIELIFTSIVCAVVFVSAPAVAALYPDGPGSIEWLLRALAVSLYFTSIRSLSALRLERRLSYDRLAWIEVLETLLFQVIAVGLAVAGLGVWSFVAATLGRAVTGATLVYVSSAWPLRPRFDGVAAKALSIKILPFEVQAVVNSSGAWITPVFVGTMVGSQAVGFLTWAAANGRKPLVFVQSVLRVAFPHFSRAQDDGPEVEFLLVRYLTVLLSLGGLWVALLAVAGHEAVGVIFTEKWHPAVFALIVFSGALLFDIVFWTAEVALNSIGLARVAAVAGLAFNILYAGVAVVLTLAIGYNGVPVAYVVAICATLPLVLRGLGAHTVVTTASALRWLVMPIAGSVIAGYAARRVPVPVPGELSRVAWLCGLTAMTYAVTTWYFSPGWFRELLKRRVVRSDGRGLDSHRGDALASEAPEQAVR
jgi:O-antigen/teichoic acid export membrane protein